MQDGIINIFKPKDWTSHDIVAVIKKITGKKIGHTGTLDPLAQGVLPILVGRGTLIAKYLNNHDKTYQVELLLGKRTETLDEEGKILEEREVPKEFFELERLEKTLQSFVGKIQQTPPIYSAIKVNGKKLYEYARNKQEVKIPTREVIIYNIQLQEIYKDEKIIKFIVECSKGTYVRTLCEDIAKKLGTIGYMKNLIRTKVGNFELKDAVSIEKIRENPKILEEKIISIESIFKDKKEIDLNEENLNQFLNGVKLSNPNKDGIYRIYQGSNFIGIGVIQKNLLKRDIIL